MDAWVLEYRAERRRWLKWLMVMILVFGLAGMAGITKAQAAPTSWSNVGSFAPSNVHFLLNVNGTLYAGTQNGSNDVWSYSNGTWMQMSGSPSYVSSLTDASGTVYAATRNGVYSFSSGTWTQMSGSPSYVHSLADVSGTLYAGANSGVYSFSSGKWTQVSGSPSVNVTSLADVSGTLYAGTYSGVYSYSNGAWLLMSGSPSYPNFMLDVNGTVYAGTTNGGNDVWSYSNGTWTQMSGSPAYVYSLADVNGTLYAESPNTGVYSYSSSTWTPISGSPRRVYSLLGVNGTLYAGAGNGSNDVHSYSNGTWSIVGPISLNGMNVTSLADVNGTLYAGTYNGSNDVWSYSNGTWTQMSSSPGNVNSLLNINGTLYAGTYNGSNDVWSYSNGTWAQVGAGQTSTPSAVNSLLDVNGTLYAGTNTSSTSVYSYSNGTWTQMSGSPSVVTSLADVNGTLYAGTRNSGNAVYAYSNGAWAPISGSPSYVNSLLDVNGTLHAGTNSGVYTYSSGTWTLMSGSPSSVDFMLDINGALYAGTSNGSNDVYSYSNGTWTQMNGSPSYVNSMLDVNDTLYTADSGVHSIGISPEAPTNVQPGSTTSTATTLSWATTLDATSYNVYENGTEIANGVTGTSYTVGNLTPGSSYSFTVSAVNVAGESSPSSAVTVNTSKIGSVDVAFGSTNVQSGAKVLVTGVVYDVYNTPVPNAIVNLSSSIGNWSAASVTADTYGKFSDSWTAPTVTTETPGTVTFSVYGTVYGVVSNVTPTTLSIEVDPLPSVSTPAPTGSTKPSPPVSPPPFTGTNGYNNTVSGIELGTSATNWSAQGSDGTSIMVQLHDGTLSHSGYLRLTTATPDTLSKLTEEMKNVTALGGYGLNVADATLNGPINVWFQNTKWLPGTMVYRVNQDGSLTWIPSTVLSSGWLTVSVTPSDLKQGGNLVMVLPDAVQTLRPNEAVVEADGVVQPMPTLNRSRETFAGLYYVNRMLKQSGIESHWNGKSWTMKTTQSVNVTATTANPKTGEIPVVVNGTTVGYLPETAAPDGWTHHRTTYVAIPELDAVLESVFGTAANWIYGQ